ncbi:hypothetical protein SCREM2_gp157 [Synechococcus phage S-CREM2]|nr:hypothetical protein SCREM2_gp157 [Synechococcus phage S-CREM2]
MLQALADLLKAIVKPESNWGQFSRKMLGLLISAAVSGVIWNVYFNYQRTHTGEQAVGEVIEQNPNKKKIIRELLERIKSSNREIESVWLYSWPDSRNLIPVMYVGDSLSPVPLGSFREGDEHAVGTFVLDGCAQINRRVLNYSCSVTGFQNAWGVVVVTYPDGYVVTENDISDIKATARRMGVVLYSNDLHNGSID